MNDFDNLMDLLYSEYTGENECIEMYLSLVPDFTIVDRAELLRVIKSGVLMPEEMIRWIEALENNRDAKYFDFETEEPVDKLTLLKRLNMA